MSTPQYPEDIVYRKPKTIRRRSAGECPTTRTVTHKTKVVSEDYQPFPGQMGGGQDVYPSTVRHQAPKSSPSLPHLGRDQPGCPPTSRQPVDEHHYRQDIRQTIPPVETLPTSARQGRAQRDCPPTSGQPRTEDFFNPPRQKMQTFQPVATSSPNVDEEWSRQRQPGTAPSAQQGRAPQVCPPTMGRPQHPMFHPPQQQRQTFQPVGASPGGLPEQWSRRRQPETPESTPQEDFEDEEVYTQRYYHPLGSTRSAQLRRSPQVCPPRTGPPVIGDDSHPPQQKRQTFQPVGASSGGPPEQWSRRRQPETPESTPQEDFADEEVYTKRYYHPLGPAPSAQQVLVAKGRPTRQQFFHPHPSRMQIFQPMATSSPVMPQQRPGQGQPITPHSGQQVDFSRDIQEVENILCEFQAEVERVLEHLTELTEGSSGPYHSAETSKHTPDH